MNVEIKEIHVTKQDILTGVCGDYTKCAVAAAVTRELGLPVRVDGESITFYAPKVKKYGEVVFNKDGEIAKGKELFTVDLPYKVHTFIGNFDSTRNHYDKKAELKAKRALRPIAFTVPVPVAY